MNQEDKQTVSNSVMEGMTSLSALIQAKRDRINDRPIDRVLFDRQKKVTKARELLFLRHAAEEFGFPIEEVDSERIAAVTTGNSHGGIIALCGDRSLSPLGSESLPESGFFVYLDGIEDPFNFGFTLRSLYAAGVDGVILPPRNWMSAAGVVARSSAGTSERLPVFTAEADDMAKIFHQKNYTIVSAGIRDSVPADEADLKRPLLLVIGGEKRGISRGVLALSDAVVRIPYGRDFRGSLSTASAATVLAFEVLRQNRAKNKNNAQNNRKSGNNS